MNHLRFTTKFKKDLKRYERQTAKIGKLLKLLSFLKNDLPIPAIYKAHTLKGDYAGCMECHIEGDFLLIWFDLILVFLDTPSAYGNSKARD